MPKRSWGDEYTSELIRDEFELDDEDVYEDRIDSDGAWAGFEDGADLASEERLTVKEDDLLDD